MSIEHDDEKQCVIRSIPPFAVQTTCPLCLCPSRAEREKSLARREMLSTDQIGQTKHEKKDGRKLGNRASSSFLSPFPVITPTPVSRNNSNTSLRLPRTGSLSVLECHNMFYKLQASQGPGIFDQSDYRMQTHKKNSCGLPGGLLSPQPVIPNTVGAVSLVYLPPLKTCFSSMSSGRWPSRRRRRRCCC